MNKTNIYLVLFSIWVTLTIISFVFDAMLGCIVAVLGLPITVFLGGFGIASFIEEKEKSPNKAIPSFKPFILFTICSLIFVCVLAFSFLFKFSFN